MWGQHVFKELDFFNCYIQQGCIKLIKSDIYNVTKDFCFQINAGPLKLSLSKNPDKMITVLSSTTVFNIDNNKKNWAPKQYIRMISEGSQ